MDFSTDKLYHGSVKDATKHLHQAGKSLTGGNLRRRSWQQIVTVLRTKPHATQNLLDRLEKAIAYRDATRILQLATQLQAKQTRGSGGKKKRSTRPNQHKINRELNLVDEDEDEPDELDLFYEFEVELEDDERVYQAWQHEQTILLDEESYLFEGLRPMSPVQRLAVHLATRQEGTPAWQFGAIGQILGPEGYRKLRTEIDIGPQPPLEAGLATKPSVLAIQKPAANTTVEIDDGFQLLAYPHLEKEWPANINIQVNYPKIGAWLFTRFTQSTGKDSAFVALVAYQFIRDAAPDTLRQFLHRCVTVHPDWQVVLYYFLMRRHILHFDSKSIHHFSERRAINWEKVMLLGSPSRLVTHNLSRNLTDIVTVKANTADAMNARLVTLLACGVGSLRRSNYPSFNVVTRPAVATVDRPTYRQLLNMATEITFFEHSLVWWPENTVMRLITHVSGAAAMSKMEQGRLWGVINRHTIAYIWLRLKIFPDRHFRLRHKHIRQFWVMVKAGEIENLPSRLTLTQVLKQGNSNVLKEGLIHALLMLVQTGRMADKKLAFAVKQALIHTLRQIAFTYNIRRLSLAQPHTIETYGWPEIDDVVGFLIHQISDGPRHVTAALKLKAGQRLPQLAKTRVTPLEQQYQTLLKEITGASRAKVEAGKAAHYSLRPISKKMAIQRGTLGGDCATDVLPFRALLPYQIFYGIFDNAGRQRRGYISLIESWAEDEHGKRRPVLAVESINIPSAHFDGVQQDLLLLFDMVARQRGLFPRVVLITRIGTWNYRNGHLVSQLRRFKQGTGVQLSPADPVQHNLYTRLAREADYFSPYTGDIATMRNEPFRVLAPFDPKLDAVQSENLAEAERLFRLPPQKPVVTVYHESGEAVGFITELPDRF